MAVLVMRTIASRGLKIFGSGTSWTSTRFFPIQQLAFMSNLARSQKGDSFIRRGGSRGVHAAVNAGVGMRDRAGLEHLLQPPQVACDLLPRLFTEKLGNGGA